jgi:tRNA A37 threonylcarbamoyladenosine synthetase subunit TsaC/SUA5/YrdC
MFSIIAPDFDWIAEKYKIPQTDPQFPINQFPITSTPITINSLKKYLENYHGVTYIFSYETPGVRIIKHPFQNFVQTLNDAFITTSCNIAGEPIVTDVKNIPADIAQQVDYIIDG